MAAAGKRILFIAPQPFFQWRGSPIRVAFDVQALAELGHEVDLLTLPVGEPRAIPGVRVIRVGNPLRVRNIPIGPSAGKAFFDLLLLLRGLRLARRNRYQAIHAIEDAGIVGLLISRRIGARLIFEKHSDPASHKKGRLRAIVLSLYGIVERFTMRHADAIIGTGPGLVDQARRVAPATPVHHIFDIPSSLAEAAPEDVEHIRRQLQENDAELIITYVGSFAVYQGIELMFSSIPLVVRANKRARFVVIGGSEAEIAERKAQMISEGVAHAVTFVGKVPPDELPNYLAASDLLLSPRIAGTNTPLKLLDYLKAGGAIVATDTAANRLLVDDTVALLTPPDASAYAAGMLALLADPDRRRAMGTRGQDLIRERFNFEGFRLRIGRCYEQLDTAAD